MVKKPMAYLLVLRNSRFKRAIVTTITTKKLEGSTNIVEQFNLKPVTSWTQKFYAEINPTS
jgi:hypothetical protein